MIVTVTLNLALDVTYRVDALRPYAVHPVRAVSHRAGGKGVNVARVLRQLGEPVLVAGLAGGPTGERVAADLDAAGLPRRLLPVADETRRTVAVVDAGAGDSTLFNEPGPVVTAEEWDGWRALFPELLEGARAVVLSGSLPRGVPRDAYAVLAGSAAARGVPVVLDTHGDALVAGVGGRPALVKPNAEEAARATGERDPSAAALALRDAGAQAVVCSLGPEGLLAVTDQGCWTAAPPRGLAGNPVGAGDAAVAALTRGMVSGEPWPERLRTAVAASAAAVLAPVAGEFDPAAFAELLPRVVVRESA